MSEALPQFARKLAVISSNIKSIAYDPITLTLQVEFNSGIYHYVEVPPLEFAKLMNAPSVGEHLAKAIKGKFEYKKIEEK